MPTNDAKHVPSSVTGENQLIDDIHGRARPRWLSARVESGMFRFDRVGRDTQDVLLRRVVQVQIQMPMQVAVLLDF